MKFEIGDKVTVNDGHPYEGMTGVVDTVNEDSLWPYGVVFAYDDPAPGELGEDYELFTADELSPAYRVDPGPRTL